LLGSGFDDVLLSSMSAPSLTTVRQPLEAMGNLAVNIVMEGVNAGLESAIGVFRGTRSTRSW